MFTCIHIPCVSMTKMQQLLPVWLWSNVTSDLLNNTGGNRRHQAAHTGSHTLLMVIWLLALRLVGVFFMSSSWSSPLLPATIQYQHSSPSGFILSSQYTVLGIGLDALILKSLLLKDIQLSRSSDTKHRPLPFRAKLDTVWAVKSVLLSPQYLTPPSITEKEIMVRRTWRYPVMCNLSWLSFLPHCTSLEGDWDSAKTQL